MGFYPINRKPNICFVKLFGILGRQFSSTSFFIRVPLKSLQHTNHTFGIHIFYLGIYDELLDVIKVMSKPFLYHSCSALQDPSVLCIPFYTKDGLASSIVQRFIFNLHFTYRLLVELHVKVITIG